MRRAIVVLVMTLAVAGCTRSNAANEPARQRPAVPVEVATVARKALPVDVQAIGTVETLATVAVRALVGGQLVRVHLREGEEVRKGDLLFTIDPRPLEAGVAQAQANLEKTRAQVAQARANLERDLARVAQTRAVLARDRAQAKNAEAVAARWAELFQRGLIAREQWEQVRTNAEALTATVKADESDVASAEEAVHAARALIASVEQTVRADDAVLGAARLQLGYTEIRAPIHGRAGALMLHEGNVVRASGSSDSTLVVLNQMDPIGVSFAVPERDLPALRRYAGAGSVRVEALIAGEEDRPVRGAVTFIDNAVDRQTGTIKARATFGNEQRRLWPGQFVNVVVTLTTEPDVIVMPSRALQTGQAGPYVFVVKADSTIEARPVVPGRARGNEMVVARGLAPGDTIVTDGHLRLVPGTKVQVKGRS